MEYVLVIGLFFAEKMEYDTREFVGRSCNGLWFAKLASDTSEELVEIILGVMERVNTHP